MPRHAILRGATFYFQMRVPKPLVRRWGFTHFHRALGNMSAAEADRRASILAGGLLEIMMPHLSFIDADTDDAQTRSPSDDELLATCRWWLQQEPWATVLNRQIDELGPGELHRVRDRLAKSLVERNTEMYDDLQQIYVPKWDAGTARFFEGQAALLKSGYAEPSHVDSMRAADLLEKLIDERVEARYRTIFAPPKSIEPTPSPAVSTIAEPTLDAPTVNAETPLSVAIAPILAARAKALRTRPNSKRYVERLETAVEAFTNLVGDKPVGKYRPSDLQNFVNLLAKVPSGFRGKAGFRTLTHSQAIQKNGRLKVPLPTLAQTTIESYQQALTGLWTRLVAEVDGVRDIGAVTPTIPEAAEVDRLPFTSDELTTWLAVAAVHPLAHMRWLPLVGLLTGMRLAEIVDLQPSDFIEEDGMPAISLWRDLEINGQKVARKLKTKTSRRVIVLPKFLVDCGFVAWAKAQPGPFVFAGWHQNAKSPSHEASKRMNDWLRKVCIHEKSAKVFHSLRHNNKAWLRRHVSDRTADLYNGHSLDGVAQKYGAKSLEDYEAVAIYEAALPPGVDFSPFLTTIPAAEPVVLPPRRPVARRKPIRRMNEVKS